MSRACDLLSLALGLVALSAAPTGAAEAGASPAAQPNQVVRFNRDIRPILSENCFYCHGPDSTHRKEGLRFDREEGLFGPRDNGPAFVKGNVKESQACKRIISDDPDELMPPPKSNKKLTAAQKEAIRRWVEQGAVWEPLWSFVVPVRSPLPPVKHADWVKNPIDRFILARLESEGLEPAPEADRRTLIRRVTLDLIGLPPVPAEVEAFVADPSPDAYEKVVDRLMASPHYGEHRARYWLDCARYGDTHGIHIDNYREIWPYRDWVIDAFNRNQTFDQFTIDQLAGDLRPHPTLEQEIATGFHRCNITTSEGGSIPDEVEATYAKDRADTTGTVWLGLTVGCATCHDHKFDPITQKEYYQLTSFFRNTLQKPLDGNISITPPNLVVAREQDRPRWNELQNESVELAAQKQKLRSEGGKEFSAWAQGDAPKSLHEPLDPADQLLALALDEGEGASTASIVDGTPDTIPLGPGLTWGDGPAKDKSLHFGPKAALEIPRAGDLEADEPFSLGGWVFVPASEGNYVVASKFDTSKPEKGAKGHPQGWVLEIAERTLSFRLVGTGPGDGLQVRGNISLKLQSGKWNHVFVTYDGSRELEGLGLYVDGKPQYTEQPEDVSIKSSIRNAGALSIGSDGRRDLHGGAVQGFTIFRRELTEEEVTVLSKWGGLHRALAKVDATFGKLTGPERQDLLLLYLNRFDEPYRNASDKLAKVGDAQREIRRHSAMTLVMQEKPKSEPIAHVLYRGQYDQPKDEVHPGTLASLHPFPKDAPRNRLGLARWLVDPANPLTSRVTVNRFWQEIFGQGIVRSSEDFGINGDNPSHPELLDWLAVEFENPSTPTASSPQPGSTALPQAGWDMKRLVRLMVTSAVYRQAALATPEKLSKDPGNRLLSRGPRFRMDAEVLRDCALAESGLLSPKIGGPSVKPYQPPGVWEAVAMLGSNTRFYKQDTGENLYRRSLYTFWKRSAPPASLEVFNAPSRETCTVRRERTDTPLQALVTMNDPQWVEAARVLAQHAMLEARVGEDPFDSRLDYLTARVLSRSFDPAEREICRKVFDDFLAEYRKDPEAAKKLIATGESKPDAKLPTEELAAWTMLASQVMNTDEGLNK